jgi:hypothetical protein
MSAKPKTLAKGLWRWTERHPEWHPRRVRQEGPGGHADPVVVGVHDVVGHAHRSVSLVIEDPRSSTGIPPAASIGA